MSNRRYGSAAKGLGGSVSVADNPPEDYIRICVDIAKKDLKGFYHCVGHDYDIWQIFEVPTLAELDECVTALDALVENPLG